MAYRHHSSRGLTILEQNSTEINPENPVMYAMIQPSKEGRVQVVKPSCCLDHLNNVGLDR